jgi:cell division septation protein DedD
VVLVLVAVIFLALMLRVRRQSRQRAFSSNNDRN